MIETRITWPSISLAELKNSHWQLADVMHGNIDGITITNVLSSDILTNAVDNIRKVMEFNTFQTYDVIEDDYHLGTVHSFEQYLDKAQQRQNSYLNLLGFNPDILFTSILKELSSLPAQVPTYKDRRYKGTVVKAYKEGQQFLTHIDRLSVSLPQYEHLKEFIDFNHKMSLFLVLQAPKTGGDLVMYDLNWQNTPKPLKEISDLKMQMMEEYLMRKHQITHQIQPVRGNLMLFRGGSQWHKVSPIIGDQWRITLGGFLAPDLAGKQLFFWG